MNVALWWIGAGKLDPEVMEQVRYSLTEQFATEVVAAERGDYPAEAYDLRRKQFASARLVKWLGETCPPGHDRVLGIFDQDLFIPVLSYVFGEAQLGGRAAVVSTARLEPVLGGLPEAGWRALLGRGQKPRQLFLSRVVKEAVHELGHTFGLVHCSDPVCVMSRSASLAQVDVKAPVMCHRCHERLHLHPAVENPR